jgi:ubiquinone/menaquinone biosynthesis C-methylase UbiE
MALETAAANEAALGFLDLQPDDRVLEVGFGHGATIARAAAAVSRGFVAGVDPSADMCRMAARRNRSSVAAGRVELRRASVEALPYPDGSFDKALSVHTLYFWPNLGEATAEIRRVMRSPGRLVLAWRHDPEVIRRFPTSVYRFHDEATVVEALKRAGLGPVAVVHREHGPAILRLAVASVAPTSSSSDQSRRSR